MVGFTYGSKNMIVLSGCYSDRAQVLDRLVCLRSSFCAISSAVDNSDICRRESCNDVKTSKLEAVTGNLQAGASGPVMCIHEPGILVQISALELPCDMLWCCCW